MKPSLLIPILLILIPRPDTEAQDRKGKLKVFIDCSNTFCDQAFIRTEINMVDFLLDRVASDVHVLITAQDTGSGGEQFQLIFFGQHDFKNHRDTLRFSTDPNITDFEERDQLLLYLKLGLAPLIAKTSQASRVSISLKSDAVENSKEEQTTDSWNYWVYKIGGDGFIRADQNYTSLQLEGRMSASRITDKIKARFSVQSSLSNDKYVVSDQLDNDSTVQVENTGYGFNNLIVWSLNERWSVGYELEYLSSTFSNYHAKTTLLPQIEYAFFPYKEVNTKYLAFRYGIGAQYNNYYNLTLFNKLDEYLFGQRASLTLGFNQKWGTVNTQLRWSNYFHDWNLYNLRISTGSDVRITGGLSLYVYFFGGLAQDQINILKDGASSTEVLTRGRQLASSFEFETFFGLNYRFGSKLNNFVNPRFEGPEW